MALKLKYKDEHGILHIDVSPTTSPVPEDENRNKSGKSDLTDPKFDTINNRFAQYDLFGGKYDVEIGANSEVSGENPRSLFRSRYNSIEEELANTPYAFATARSLRVHSANNNPIVDITIKSCPDTSPSRDIEDDRFFNRPYGLFGPPIDGVKSSDDEETPAFTVTQLIHAQDRYFDLSSKQSVSEFDSPRKSSVRNLTSTFEVKSVPNSAGKRTVDRTVGRAKDCGRTKDSEAFQVLTPETAAKGVQVESSTESLPIVPTPKKKRETAFSILTELPAASRPSSPRSLPVEIRTGRVSPFKGRGFREETSRHTTPRASAANSRASSPPPRRTTSLPRIDTMAQAATLPLLSMHTLSRPHSPRNFLRENIEEVREMSEFNRELHEAEAEKKRKEEEEALLKEMGLLDKNAKSENVRSTVCSRVNSRSNSRSNSPGKINLRSRSNSPSAIVHFENISTDSSDFVNSEDGMPKPAIRKSRERSLSKSQPQSNDGSPKHSKIPKRQSSVSPSRAETKRDLVINKRNILSNLNKNQKYMSNSTSSIHETIRIGSQVHDKRGISKSSQFLDIGPTNIRGKPPISPGRGGPPPSNRTINAKRLSPIVGTPNKSPTEDQKPVSAKTTPTKPSATTRRAVKPAPNTVTSKVTSRPAAKTIGSRDPSPDKRRVVTRTNSSSAKTNGTIQNKPATRATSTKIAQKPALSKPDIKKPINRTSSVKNLARTPSTKNLNEKPPVLKKRDSKKDLMEKSQSTPKINEIGKTDVKKELKRADSKKDLAPKSKSADKKANIQQKETQSKPVQSDVSTQQCETPKQDSETQYDKITNEKGELIILTKKNVVSMTTAAITSQPLELVTTVTNQLPSTFEKAREKALFERLNSRESLGAKDDEKESEEKADEKKASKTAKSTIFTEENVKLRPLQPPYNNPQVERVRQKIDTILKEPEVSPRNILSAAVKSKEKEAKSTFRGVADQTKADVKEAKDQAAAKLTEIKDQTVKQSEVAASEIRTEATKIIESIMTPIEEPKTAEPEKPKPDQKQEIDPIVTVVNEKKKNGPNKSDVMEKINETVIRGDPEAEVQSSNLSTPGVEKMAMQSKMVESGGSDKSVSNGGFPQSTSTTPKPPARAHRQSKESSEEKPSNVTSKEPTPESQPPKQPNICTRLLNKCKNKCCPCCIKPEDDENEMQDVEEQVEKKGIIDKLNCCKKRDMEQEDKVRDLERAAGKAATIEFENETRPKRTFRDVICCCKDHRRVSDSSDIIARDVTSEITGEVTETGCCGRKRRGSLRRDSILSDHPPATCCNNRLFNWLRGACRRRQSERSSSRRTSMFSKNKSLSPTLPPEDTRKKLDTSLIEHTSVMRGAIPVLPIVLAYFCLFCNVVVPGLGTIFSGLFCLCFGIPRFGVHDGAKYRIGAFVINLLVGAGQLFTVLFCLVGWGWSIWWGVIMLKTARKYRKLKAEEAAAEAENAPPVTTNNRSNKRSDAMFYKLTAISYDIQ